VGGEADGIGAGSLFKTVVSIPGDVVELAAKGELTETDCVRKVEDGGLLAGPDS
jgi:hypothetical protein